MTDTAFTILAWVLTSLAIGLLLWALGWDWIHQLRLKRRRCPKCWYDLSHTPRRRCSECGHEAKRERQLFKGRRRWKVAVLLPLVFLSASHAARRTPEMRERGWVAGVPTTILIRLLPEAELEAEQRCDEYTTQWNVNPYAAEMAERVHDGEVAWWQYRWAIERCRVIRTRDRWPIDEPLRVGVFLPYWLPYEFKATPLLEKGQTIEFQTGAPISGTGEPWYEADRQDQVAGRMERGLNSVRFGVHIERSYGQAMGIFSMMNAGWEGEICVPVAAVTTIGDAITAVNSPEISKFVRTRLGPYVSMFKDARSGRTRCYFTLDIDRSPHPQLDDISIRCLFDLVNSEGEVVETIDPERPTRMLFLRSMFRYTFRLSRLDGVGGNKTDLDELGNWTIRVRGDARRALSEFECDQYWAGSLEYNLAEIWRE